MIEVNSRFSKYDLKEMKKEKKNPLNMEILRPIHDEEFEIVPFGEDPSKCFNIGKEQPDLV